MKRKPVPKGKGGKRKRGSSWEEDDTSEERVDEEMQPVEVPLGINGIEESSRSIRSNRGGRRKRRSEVSSVEYVEEDMVTVIESSSQ
jgi:hypothetical protein